ncbi:hypothetical protein F511_03679 [Dorcoceras hygrometricum]|uniref:Uncharacterized protein n=1 Tax=Dorcoceras hygrometricum TaxID=472368 RepID=A0A2Z7BKE0_9LAMI|nr:hypothetical protein F511_03679 [Dorcoceras hygrometricum]
MQKIGNNTQPIGICRRLINFVISMLSRSMTLVSEEVPDELPSTRNETRSDMSPIKPNGHSYSEVEVEFRHKTTSKGWKPNELGELIHFPEKDGLILSQDQAIQHRGFEGKGMATSHSAANIGHSPHKRNGKKTRERLLQLEPLPMMDDGRKAPVKSEIAIEEITGEDDRYKNKEANISVDEATNHELRQRRLFGPLFSVASNINEKSDAYISSRKKAMHRNYNLEPEKP